MKWSLLGRRRLRGLSVCILSSPCWQNDIPHDWNAPRVWFSCLQHTIHYLQMISDTESKISSLQSPFQPPIYWYCCPCWAPVMTGLCTDKTGAVNLRESKHINILFSVLTVKRGVFVCTPCGYRKLVFTPSTPNYPALELWPATYSLLISAFCCRWAASATYKHPCWPTSLLLCAIQKK